METWHCPDCDKLVEERKLRGPHLSVCRRQKAAKYIYKPGDKHPYEYKVCPECRKVKLIRRDKETCSYRCSKLGDRNPSKQKSTNHNLTKVQYVRAHEIVRKTRGKAVKCVNGCPGRKIYHWANLTGDYWNPEDYQEMCVPCHDRFDRNKGSQ